MKQVSPQNSKKYFLVSVEKPMAMFTCQAINSMYCMGQCRASSTNKRTVSVLIHRMYCNTKLVAPLQLHCNNCTGQCVAQAKATHVGAHPRPKTLFLASTASSSSSTLYTLPVTQLVEVETSFEASQLLDIELQLLLLLLQLLQCCIVRSDHQ